MKFKIFIIIATLYDIYFLIELHPINPINFFENMVYVFIGMQLMVLLADSMDDKSRKAYRKMLDETHEFYRKILRKEY